MSPLRSVRLLLGLYQSVLFNRIWASRPRQSKDPHGPAKGIRPPTTRRRVGMGLLVTIFIPCFLLQIALLANQFLYRAWQQDLNLPSLSPATWQLVQQENTPIQGVKSWAELQKARQEHLKKIIAADPAIQALSESERSRTVQLLAEQIRTYGGAALKRQFFSSVHADALVHSPSLSLVAALMGIMGLFVITSGLGMGNQDLGRVSPLSQWLVCYPLSDRVLALGRLFGIVGTAAFFWLSVPVFILTTALLSGWYWWQAILLAGTGSLALSLLFASIQMVFEDLIRARFDHGRRKNLQALATILALLFMVLVYGACFSTGHGLPAWFTALGSDLWLWIPFCWPMIAALGGGVHWLIGTIVVAVAAAAGAVSLAAITGRAGLEWTTGTLSAARNSLPNLERRWLPLHIWKKEALLLIRDRAFLVAVLVTPLAVVAIQLVVHPGLWKTVGGNLRYAAVGAFLLGGYILLHGAATILSSEGSALWILMGAPHSLRKVLLGKLLVWISLASIYAIVTLSFALAFIPWPGPEGISDLVMVLIGLPIFAAIAAGLGAAATDPLIAEIQRRVRPSAMFLYLGLMAGFTQILFTAGVHGRLAYLMICGLLAYGLWQRLDDRLPYLLDPGEQGARRLSLSDGALGVVVFFVLQSLGAVILYAFDIPESTVVVLSFAAAGVLAGAGVMLWLWREGVKNLMCVVGLWPQDGQWMAAGLRSLGFGILAGGLALGAAATYTAILMYCPLFEPLRPAKPEMTLDLLAWAFLAVVLAPVFEEILFRGLLLGGLLRSLPLWAALCTSAGVFALVHPSSAIIPVFILGLFAGLAYRWSGWLLAAIIAHAVYNAGIVASTIASTM